MIVQVLGPLAIGGDGGAMDVRPPRSARLLARLVVGQPWFVTVDALVDVLWRDGHRPARPERAVHDAAADLRRLLRAVTGEPLIETRSDGRAYRLAIAGEDLDVVVATELMTAASTAAEHARWADAADQFGAVLALFRGEPYEGFEDDEFVWAELARLGRLRSDAQEGRLLAMAASGDRAFLAEVAHLAPQLSSRWRVWAAWMQALYVEGRQGEALEVYRRARRELAEIGLEPHPELRDLDRRIAIDDPSLRPTGPSTPSPGAVLPAFLVAAGRSLVARSWALDELDAAWSAAAGGHTSIVSLTGEEGIGKTSVAAAFARRVVDQGATVLAGRCQPEPTRAYEPIAEALAGRLPSDGAATPGDPSARRPVDDRTGNELPSQDSLAAARNRLFRVIVQVIHDVATERPLLLVLEDLHWADRNTSELLCAVLRDATPSRLMLLLTARDDEVDDDHPLRLVWRQLVRHPGARDVHLTGLDRAGTSAYLAEVWPELGVHDELAEPLRASTEGNPLFLGEVVQELRRHAPADVGESLAVLRAAVVPHGISELTTRRMAMLSPDARRMMSLAAVIGATFAVPTLEAMDLPGGRAAVLAALEQGIEAGILTESADVTTMAFRHRYFRDVVYQRLAGPRRADLHYRVALGLERDGAPARVIAHHLLEAGAMGDVDRAVDAAVEAARHAVSQLDATDAATLLRRTLDMLERGARTDIARRCEVVLLLAQLLLRSGDHVVAKTVAAEAWELARQLGDESKMVVAALEHGRFGLRFGADATSIDLLERTIAMTTTPEHRAQATARLAMHIGAFGDDPQRAARLGREALAMAEPTADPLTITRAVWCLGIATLGHPNTAEREALGRRLLAAAASSGDETTLANGLRLLAISSMEQGDLADFDRCVDRLDLLADEVSSWVYAVDVARWRAMRAMLDGDWDAAALHVEEHGRLGGAQGVFTISHVGQRLFLARERGDVGKVRELAELIQTHAPRFDILRGVMALTEAEAGNREAAVAHFSALTEAGPSYFLNRTYATNVAFLIEAAARLELSTAWLESEMERYAGTLLICSWGEGCAGAADRFVGMARTLRGAYDEADVAFERAAQLEARVGSARLQAATATWRDWAAARRDRAQRHPRRGAPSADVEEAIAVTAGGPADQARMPASKTT